MTPQRPALLVGHLHPLLRLGARPPLRAADIPSAPADSEWPGLAALARIEVTSIFHDLRSSAAQTHHRPPSP